MKKTLLIPIILIAISVHGYSQTKNFIHQPYIETTASVDSMVVPDRIYMDIVITEKDTKGKISVEELESKMETTLKSLGINTAEDLVLADATSNFHKYFLKSKDVHKSKAYSLLVNDAKSAGKAIIALEKMDISNVRLNRVEYSGFENLKSELMAMAVTKAKNQAEKMVKTINQQVGKAIYISNNLSENEIYGLQGTIYGFTSKLRANRYEDDFVADIEFQKIKVASSVNVKFILE